MPSGVMSASRMRGSRPLSGAMKALSKPQYEAPEKQGEMYPMRWPPYNNVSTVWKWHLSNTMSNYCPIVTFYFSLL